MTRRDIAQGSDFRQGFATTALEDGATTGQVPALGSDGQMEFAAAGGGSPPITIRNVWTGSPVAIADGARGFPTWDNQTVGDEPSPWLDTTNTMEPSILEDGLYAVSVTVATDAITAGGGFILTVLLDSESEIGATSTNQQIGPELAGYASATVSTTWYLQEGAQILVQVDSRDGASSRNFSLGEAVVQKLS